MKSATLSPYLPQPPGNICSQSESCEYFRMKHRQTIFIWIHTK